MRSLAMAMVTLGVASGALRGQTREYASAPATVSPHHHTSSSKLTARLAAANAELRRLEFMETSSKRTGQGTPTTATAAKSIYHADKHEEQSLKQAPLPPPRFLSASAKVVPSFSGSTNPYSQGSPYGRGYQDAMTPMTGSFANQYGPASGGPMGTQGYGSFPQQVDPRGFGSTFNYSTPYSSFFGPLTDKGISSQGFKYQVPYSNVHPSAPYTGNPFSAAYGPGGAPYYQQQGVGDASATHPTLQNYTQFGPMPFGPYGTMNTPPSSGGGGGGMMMGGGSSSIIPTSYPMGHPLTPAGPMGPAGAMGPAGTMMNGPFPGSMAPMGMGGMAAGGQQAGFNPAFGMGMIPHVNMGNMYNPAFPAGNPGSDPRSASQGMQHAWAMGMPGVGPTYNPTMAMHHGLNLPGGMGQFHDPPQAHGFGQGCKFTLGLGLLCSFFVYVCNQILLLAWQTLSTLFVNKC